MTLPYLSTFVTSMALIKRRYTSVLFTLPYLLYAAEAALALLQWLAVSLHFIVLSSTDLALM